MLDASAAADRITEAALALDTQAVVWDDRASVGTLAERWAAAQEALSCRIVAYSLLLVADALDDDDDDDDLEYEIEVES